MVVVLDGIPASSMPQSMDSSRVPAINRGVPITVEAHTALLTGRHQPLATFAPGQQGAWRSTVPTIFELLTTQRDVDPNTQLAAMANTVLLSEVTTSRAPHMGSHTGPPMEILHVSDRTLLDAVQTRLMAEDIHFMLVNLHDMDQRAHDGEDYHPLLDARLEEVDALRMWLQQTPPYADRTHLLVLSDHGRHDWGEDADWWNHGDQCVGCREIALHWFTPSGESINADTPMDLTDISAALAHTLQLEQPLGQGSLVGRTDSNLPALPLHLIHDSGKIWFEDTALNVDGEPIQVVGWDATGRILCWRSLPTATDGWQSWRPHCMDMQAPHTALPLPATTVSALWQPAFHLHEDTLWLADHTNINEFTGSSTVMPQLSRGRFDAWEQTQGPEVIYPQDVSLVVDGPADARIALIDSESESQGRDSRQIHIWSVHWPELDTAQWSEVGVLQPEPGIARLSSPALHGHQVAALQWPEDGGLNIAVADIETGHWVAVPLGDCLMGHIPPRWDAHGVLWWVRQPTLSTIAICQWDGDASACTTMEAASADHLSIHGDTVSIAQWNGHEWSTATISPQQK